jgi:LacI family transcriptional regulator
MSQTRRQRRSLGSTVPTIKDIAAACGTAPSTISRVLNNRPGFSTSEKTRQLIIETAHALGYQPNHAAANLRRQKTNVVAILGNRLSTLSPVSLSERICLAATCHFSQSGYHACVWYPPRDDNGLQLPPSMIDGALVLMDGAQDALIDRLEQMALPYVAVNDIGGPSGQSIVYDDDSAMAQLYTHLMELGHRRIAYMNISVKDPCPHYSLGTRAESYAKQCRAVGATPIPGYDRHLPAEESLQLAREHGATAIILYHARLWGEALPLCRARGIRIPEELSIVCFDDMPMADCMSPAPTVIEMPIFHTAELAAKLLLNVLCDKAPAKAEPIRVNCKLIVRGSTISPSALGRK